MTPTVQPDSQRDTAALQYQPALDGVRAVAVVMVLLFHAGFSWMGGGYLGVSVFFTLSGFLITSLLLAEAERTGKVSFRHFYSRRMKRLLPASLVCLSAIIVAYGFGSEFRLVSGMRGQLWGALGQVYNWVRIAGSSSYQDLFRQAPSLVSPLEHYWSLAIEEQFYVVWPLVVWAVVARRPRDDVRSGRNVFRALVALTILCAVASPVISALTSPEVAYWSTPTRLGELLVGAAAAAWHQRGRRLPAWGKWVAIAAVAVLVVLASQLPVGSGPAYTGWMTPIGVVSALLILSLQVPGPLRSLLSVSPFVWIGKLSYGVYLYHWPVFVLLRAHGWQLNDPLGLCLALAVTSAMAVVSFFVVERPARTAVWPAPRTFAAGAIGVVFVALVIVVSPTHRGFLETNQQVLDAAAIESVVSPLESLQPASTTAWVTAHETTTTVEPNVLPLPALPNRPIRVLTIGDSTALMVGLGLADWAVEHPGYVQLNLRWQQGLGFILDGVITNLDDAEEYVTQSRAVVRDRLPQLVHDLQPDVVVLMTTVADVANRRWSEVEGPITPFDSSFRTRMKQSYTEVTTDLIAMGIAKIVWVIPPVPFYDWPQEEMRERARYLVQHDVIREVAAEQPAVVLLELEDWFGRSGRSRDENWRPDGVHIAEDAANQLANDYLGPWLVVAALS